MMAPQFERARMLSAAIDRAIAELADPIERIEVELSNVFVWAGTKRLTMSYSYANSYSRDGAPLLGGGRWVVEVVEVEDLTGRRVASWAAQIRSWLQRSMS